MNCIWGGMMLVGIVYGILTGEVDALSEAMLSSAKEAVALCVTMFGIMALWSGLMEIAREANLIRAISKRLRPLLRFLFPDIPEGHPALEHIATNCVANVLGLGSASTVYGLKAMEALEALEEERRTQEDAWSEETCRTKGMIDSPDSAPSEMKQPCRAVPRGTASNEMCTFLILNISSLQLIPVNIIAYRSQYGSVNPTAIVGPGIVATAVSTGVAVVFCRLMNKKCKKKNY
ncbi:MAG: nucleoside recognition protein [Lachnospiraceae bacterium]|nr:nucleoside recognition protein [Lachnospiraceae bacterium]